MNLGKDHYHKKENSVVQTVLFSSYSFFSFYLSQWLQQKVSFEKKKASEKLEKEEK